MRVAGTEYGCRLVRAGQHHIRGVRKRLQRGRVPVPPQRRAPVQVEADELAVAAAGQHLAQQGQATVGQRGGDAGQVDHAGAGEQGGGARFVVEVGAHRRGGRAGAVVVHAAAVTGEQLLDVEPGGARRVDTDRAGVHAAAADLGQQAAPEPVVADPADPRRRYAERDQAAGHVGLGAADGAVEHVDVLKRADRAGHQHGHRFAQAHRAHPGHACPLAQLGGPPRRRGA